MNGEAKQKGCILLIWVLAVITPVFSSSQSTDCPVQSHYCPDVHSITGQLAFVDGYPKQPVLRPVTECFFLSCCTGGRPNVNTTWKKHLPGHWCVQTESQTDRDCIDWKYRYTSDNGQALVFDAAGIDDDTGRYMCIATNGQTTINRTFEVEVIQCVHDPPDVKFGGPVRPPQASVGSTYVQECQGDFGCHGAVASDSLAWWSYVNEQGRLENLTEGGHGRYSVKMSISDDEVKKAAVLTIHNVTKEDFGKVFICHLKMRDLPTAGFNFSLSEIESITDIRKYIGLIITLSSLMLIGIIAVVLIWRCCWPPVAFYLKSTFNRLPKRGEDHEFDVMLIASEEGGEEVQVLASLRAMLKDYNLCPPLKPGQYRVQAINDIEKCVSVIFIISPLTTAESLAEFDNCFSVSAEQRTRMIFVLTQSMTKSDWERLSEDYKKIYEHTPKLCPVALWPGDEGKRSWLKHKNFWGQVRRFLPRPYPPSKGRVRNGTVADGEEGEGAPLDPSSVDE